MDAFSSLKAGVDAVTWSGRSWSIPEFIAASAALCAFAVELFRRDARARELQAPTWPPPEGMYFGM